MPVDDNQKTEIAISPEEGFSILGNPVRMDVIRILGGADEPQTFSELVDQSDIETDANFSYHLRQLSDRFIRKTDRGYELNPLGRQVYQTIRSGAMTRNPTLEATELDHACYHCGSKIWYDFKNQFGYIYCPGCSGNFAIPEEELVERLGSEELASRLAVKSKHPHHPALVQDRTAEETYRAANSWFHLEMLSWGIDLCPRCSAILNPEVEVCETHDPTGGLCDECGSLQATKLVTTCSNCNYSKQGLLSYRLFSNTAMLDFITDQGLNPVSPESPETFWGYFTPYEEEIISVDPFEAHFTFRIENEVLRLHVDDNLNVTDYSRFPAE